MTRRSALLPSFQVRQVHDLEVGTRPQKLEPDRGAPDPFLPMLTRGIDLPELPSATWPHCLSQDDDALVGHDAVLDHENLEASASPQPQHQASDLTPSKPSLLPSEKARVYSESTPAGKVHEGDTDTVNPSKQIRAEGAGLTTLLLEDRDSIRRPTSFDAEKGDPSRLELSRAEYCDPPTCFVLWVRLETGPRPQRCSAQSALRRDLPDPWLPSSFS